MITPAFAQSGPAAGSSDILMSMIPFVLIFVIMWFLIIRPQQKRVKDHRELISNVRRGDNIVTSGGIIAKVTKVVDDIEVEAEIADGVRVRIMKGMITDVRAKGEPVKAEAANADEEGTDAVKNVVTKISAAKSSGVKNASSRSSFGKTTSGKTTGTKS